MGLSNTELSVIVFIVSFTSFFIKQAVQYAVAARYGKRAGDVIYVESDSPNAAAITFFNVVVVSGDLGGLSGFAMLHERYHLRQKLASVLQALAVSATASMIVVSPLALAAVYFTYVLTSWKIERDADKYAVENGAVYTPRYSRPANRLVRLIAWLLDTHPPDYIRAREDYTKKCVYSLFIEDVFT